MFTFFLIRGNWFRGYGFPLWYYPLCIFLDIIIFVPFILLFLYTLVN